MNADPDKKIILIAGPNGAGKSTFARQFLPNEARCPQFINVNLLAQGLSPFDPDAANAAARKLMDRLIREHARQGHSFAIETTFSSLAYARRIRAWHKQGYRVELYFLGLASPELSVARVATRARQGGHHVGEEEIRRRFATGLRLFQAHFQQVVDAWAWFDNSGTQPVLRHASASARDADVGAAHRALHRACLAARQLARQTGTPVHTLQNGKPVSRRRVNRLKIRQAA